MTRPAWDPHAWAVYYSNALYVAAARWGIEVPAGPDRPVIVDEQAPLGGRLPVVEELRWNEKGKGYHYVRIGIVEFNGQWSNTLSYQARRSGHLARVTSR